ncbi:eukaryotic translation initiation factor 3 subunit G-A-like [Acanthaster planci]|uniref:Eukaryotic translation initiation factor 3 subunit G n=1 Tax=Acanthaster planci TaxID=133434 RepID=A0A8B7XTX7_ACAPL|nr:eukaryotic translation initiation factor 3 subunit G-A-like [Acanthaster planci]
MPTADTNKPISWADQVEAGEQGQQIPDGEVIHEGNVKKVIEYKRNDDGKLLKIVRTFKIEKRKTSKTIAQRKSWSKFGQAADDGEGPSITTTGIADDVFMQFVTAKDDGSNQQEDDTLKKLQSQRLVMCRVCKGDHWTTKCPYKDSLEPLQEKLLQGGGADGAEGADENADTAKKPAGTGKYVPPSARDASGQRKVTPMDSKRDPGTTIRVTNLSEDTRESDLQELFYSFGPIQRIYLAMDKNTGRSKGFAFINFHNKESAASAIRGVSGFGYDHLILKVEWAKPSGSAQH